MRKVRIRKENNKSSLFWVISRTVFVSQKKKKKNHIEELDQVDSFRPHGFILVNPKKAIHVEFTRNTRCVDLSEVILAQDHC